MRLVSIGLSCSRWKQGRSFRGAPYRKLRPGMRIELPWWWSPASKSAGANESYSVGSRFQGWSRRGSTLGGSATESSVKRVFPSFFDLQGEEFVQELNSARGARGFDAQSGCYCSGSSPGSGGAGGATGSVRTTLT
jgi:hypothetical protein